MLDRMTKAGGEVARLGASHPNVVVSMFVRQLRDDYSLVKHLREGQQPDCHEILTRLKTRFNFLISCACEG